MGNAAIPGHVAPLLREIGYLSRFHFRWERGARFLRAFQTNLPADIPLSDIRIDDIRIDDILVGNIRDSRGGLR